MADIPTAPAGTPLKPASHAHAAGRGHRHAHHTHKAAQGKSFHAHVAQASRGAVSAAGGKAISEAMARENVPSNWQSSLIYIMACESGGVVGVVNHADSARGLFQLTRPNYHLNPHGAASFGNATEEAQGGIRYIRQRYQTADNAAQFWQRHGWY